MMVKQGVVWRRWQRALSEYWNSGLTVAEYCRRHNLRTRAAGKWIKRLRPDVTNNLKALEIVPVDLSSSVLLSPLPLGGGDSGIRLELGAVGVRLNRDFDATALRRVLSVLENC